jgi:ABC-type transport system involved in cytochrome c biogenesis permease component
LIGFSALATLFAAISVRLRAREMLLPLLVLPLLVVLWRLGFIVYLSASDAG